MKNSKKICTIIKKLDEIEEVFLYYANGAPHYTAHFTEIRELIEDLALDRKRDHIRLAKKLKEVWERNHNE